MASVVADPSAEAPRMADRSVFRMTAETFLRGVELGLFPAERRVFLWDGVLYEKMAKKIAHSSAGETVRLALSEVLPPGWSLWGENPILVDDFTAPLPDLTVVRGTARDYFARHAVPRVLEIGLVTEMADATLRVDLTKSLSTYAAAGLPIYWVLNLVAWRVEVYSNPGLVTDEATYTVRESYESGQDVPVVLDGVEIARVPVTSLLPAEKRPDRPAAKS